MSNYGPWSVKGIDDRAREVAKEQARLKGVTLGDYINELLLQGHSEAGPRDESVSGDAAPADQATLQGLAEKIEAVEARSTLAITGIDKSVVGLVARLEESERASSDLSENMGRLAEELKQTQDALRKKVESLEARGDGQDNLEAMKSLERGLAKLASHVYEEHTAQQDESDALRGRVEAGFEHLSEHLEAVEARIEKRLRQADDRLNDVETGRAGPGSEVVEARLTDVENSVASALNHVEGTLVEVQQRLNRAEETTDTALKALEHTFSSLNERIDAISNAADPGKADDLRAEIEARFESLASDIRKSVEDTRLSLANEIAEATRASDPQSFPALEQRLNEMSGDVESRLTALSERENQMLETVSERFNTLADQIDDQVASSEKRSADAIEQVGEQVAGAITRLQARQDETAKQLTQTLESHGASQDQKLDEALNQFQSRVDDLETRTSAALSPVQRAIAMLAARLDSVEPSGQDDGQAISDLLPDLPDFSEAASSDLDETDWANEADDETVPPAQAETRADMARVTAPVDDATDDNSEELYGAAASAGAADDEDETDFVAGLPGSDEARSDSDPVTTEASAATAPESGVDERLPTDDVDLSEWQPDPAGPHDPSAEPDDRSNRIAAMLGEQGADDTETTQASAEPLDEDDDFSSMTADLDWESYDQNPLQAEDSELDMPEAGAVAADPFDDLDEIPSLADPLATAAPAGDEADDGDFSSEFETEQPDFEDDPDHLFGAMDDGRDESRDSDVFDSDISPEADEDALWADDTFDKDDVVGFSDEDDEDDVPAKDTSADIDDEEEAADYLYRARNAAIRATGSKSARFRAHQSGRGGVDRYSAAQAKTQTSNRTPLIIGLVLFGIVAIASATFVFFRGDMFGSEPRFLLNPAPASPAAGAAPESAAEAAPSEEGETAAQAEQIETPPAADPQPQERAEAPLPQAAPEVVETSGLDLSGLIVPEALTLDAAAENGNAVAQFQLGEERLEAGAIAEGTELIRTAAENKLSAAEYRLAKLHEEGLGVPRDLGEARFWTERAAEGGNANAMHDLAVFFAEGDGGLQSYAAAAKWFRKAADFGVVDSQYNLAILYENGLGISASQQEALYWFKVAELNGDASAPADVRRLEGLMDPAIVSEIRLRANSWAANAADPEANGTFSEQSWQVSQRAQLRAVQEALNALGYDAGTPDGIMGAGTRTALQAFQTDAGLTPTGDVSDSVVLALNARLVTES